MAGWLSWLVLVRGELLTSNMLGLPPGPKDAIARGKCVGVVGIPRSPRNVSCHPAGDDPASGWWWGGLDPTNMYTFGMQAAKPAFASIPMDRPYELDFNILQSLKLTARTLETSPCPKRKVIFQLVFFRSKLAISFILPTINHQVLHSLKLTACP